MEIYKHKKTGKKYELIQSNLLVKDWNKGSVCTDESGEEIYASYGPWLQWKQGYVLYKALYDNPEGPYFVRTKMIFLRISKN